LVHFLLVEEALFRLERARMDNAYLFAVGPIDTEDAGPAGGHAEVEKPGLHRKPGRIRQQPYRERVFERFFDFLQRQRAIEIEGRIIPIKLHNGSIVFRSPMQCIYDVFTHGDHLVSTDFLLFLKKNAGVGATRWINGWVDEWIKGPDKAMDYRIHSRMD
jgi:hypothetical protein